MTPDAKSLLELLTAMAPALREAGVSEVTLPGGAHIKLTPHEPKVEATEADDGGGNGWGHPDPLQDPALYGGKVPTFSLQTRGKK